MKSIYLLVGAGLLLLLFNQFYELTSIDGASVVRTEGYHGQVYGMVVCLVAAVLLGRALYRVCRQRGRSWRSMLRLRAMILALPILWQHWSMGQFMSGAQMVSFKRGIGGPLTGEYFVAAAIALCLLDSFLSSDDFPTAQDFPHAVSA